MRYLLFAGDRYYPNGGWEDFVGRYETIEEATAHIPEFCDWWNIADLETNSIVCKSAW